MDNKLVLLDFEHLAEADSITEQCVYEPAHKKCAFTKIRTNSSTAARYTVADGCMLDDLMNASFGTRRACRLVRHVVVGSDTVLSRQAADCAPHMVLICVRGIAHVSGDALKFGRCTMDRGTMFMVKSSRSSVVCGNPACELLVFFVDFFMPIPRVLLPDEVLFTRDLTHVESDANSSVIFKVEFDLSENVCKLFIKGYIIRVTGMQLERRETVCDDCDCCYPEAPVLALDRKKLHRSARTVPTLIPGVLDLHLKERGWLTVSIDAKGYCEPDLLRIAFGSLRLVCGVLRSAVGRYHNMLFFYGIIPVHREADTAPAEMMEIE
ncbi:hypothetical protein BVTX09c1_122 [Bovine papular stomatitis virus]|uniref:Protein OPG181 n=1 Tax=Bovine papular stomatitis virus TaxID=129727 RepID=A0A0E3T921_9POXV|nr:hypothetical protein BVTX09c1_122 [Bovine papular stomatitis virus]